MNLEEIKARAEAEWITKREGKDYWDENQENADVAWLIARVEKLEKVAEAAKELPPSPRGNRSGICETRPCGDSCLYFDLCCSLSQLEADE